MDDILQHALAAVPERSIVLLEDIDAAFSKRVQTDADGWVSLPCLPVLPSRADKSGRTR